MRLSLAVLGRPLLELHIDRHPPDAEPEPEQRIGFYGGSGLYAERAETPGEMGSLKTPPAQMGHR